MAKILLKFLAVFPTTVLSFQPAQRHRGERQRRGIIPPVMTTTDYADILIDQQQPSVTTDDEVEELQRLETVANLYDAATAAGLISTAALDETAYTSSSDATTSTAALSRLPNVAQSTALSPSSAEQQRLSSNVQEETKTNLQTSNKSFRPLLRMTNNTSLEGGDLVCRVVASSDARLPTTLSKTSSLSPTLLHQLDDIYHAQAHQETRLLRYMQRPEKDGRKSEEGEEAIKTNECTDSTEEKDLVATVRASLEDAGFALLSRRDLDLCEALNAGYLLRLSILPDVSKLDPAIAQEFYPEYFDESGKVADKKALTEKLLFDGRVLVFWRGYSQEVTRGRLVLPKIDYLQASLVQRLFGMLKRRLDIWERALSIKTLAVYRQATACFLRYMRDIVDRIPNEQLSKRLRRKLRSPYSYSAYRVLNNGTLPTIKELRTAAEAGGNMFKLGRYGGSQVKFVGSPNPVDALNPFIICEGNEGFSCASGDTICNRQRSLQVDRDMYESLNNNELRCPYDAKNMKSDKPLPPMELLERVSIATLVDVFSREGRRNLFRTIFSKSELVEPTYEEVVVVWRPLSKEQRAQKRIRMKPPKILYELADMFDIDGLPELPKEQPMPARMPLEIRTFEGVPMANLPAVLPKTRLVFRPADAVVLDSVSILTLLFAASSMRFDNPRLDLIALVSLVLWVIRTVFRYSNKLARYDLLVKKFLTSKLSNRNSGALKYLASQAGSQRAARAALVHEWLTNELSEKDEPLQRLDLILRGKREINDLIDDLKDTPIDVDAALNDLEDLQLVTRSDSDGQLLNVIRGKDTIDRTLKRTWGLLFDGKISLKGLIGRRQRESIVDDSTAAP